MEPQHNHQGRSIDGGDYSGTWEQLPQTNTTIAQPSTSATGVEGSSVERVDDSDSDIAVGVDLDGFSVLPFDDGGGFSIDYEPFGLLLDGI